jgi:hypothetical protein
LDVVPELIVQENNPDKLKWLEWGEELGGPKRLVCILSRAR